MENYHTSHKNKKHYLQEVINSIEYKHNKGGVMMLEYKDKVQIIFNSEFCETQKKILYHLYQPIIGTKAVCLYFALIAEYLPTKEFNLDLDHHRISKILDCSIEEIIDARHKLEAIKLLNVYVKDNTSGGVLYYYEIVKPLAAEAFFAHSQFNPLLMKCLENYDYERTLFMFLPRAVALPNLVLINKSFDEIFVNKQLPIDTKNSTNDVVINPYYNSANLHDSKNETIITSNSTNLQQANAFIKPYSYHVLDFSSCDLEKNDGDLVAKKEAMKNTSAYNYLVSLQNYPLQEKDIELLNKLINYYCLSTEVVNCLLEYVWYKNNKILVVAYLEKIAQSLSTYQIKTVEQALRYFKKAYNQSHAKSQPENKNDYIKSYKTYNNNGKREFKKGIVPQWIAEDSRYKN